MNQLSVLILAAGRGVRMKSDLPKVMHRVGGVPMVERVLSTLSHLKPNGACVIVGFGGDKVRDHLRTGYPKTVFVTQKVLNGSGGAVRYALSWLRKQKGEVIIACGDAPLIRRESFADLVKLHRSEKNLATVLTARLPNPKGYGRIVRDGRGAVTRIVEELDATDRERQIDEINTGTYCFDARALAKALPRLSNKNAKKEFYLTDTLELIRGTGGRIGGMVCAEARETMGVNRRSDLAAIEKTLFRRNVERLMDAGVTVIDPDTTYVGDGVTVGAETVIWPQTFLLGTTRIGSGCQIGPWSHLQDTEVGDNVQFKASFATQSKIKNNAKIGPFSHIRPNSVLGENVHMGNFSETKNAVLGQGSKLNHLSYLGDATVGKYVNIGAGSITCNYDGVLKHPTRIQDNAFIGSNVNLIAPVRVGAHAVVGAGSSISDDVPSWSLAVERSRTLVKKNWAKRRFKKGKKK